VPDHVTHLLSCCERPGGTADPKVAGVSWTCPTCGRRFAHVDQSHSHDIVDVEAHFAGRPDHLRETYDRLVACLPAGVAVESLKSVVILSAAATFSFVTVQSRRLLVGIFLDRQLDSPRVIKIDVMSARKIANIVAISRIDDVDAELGDWLREAHSRLGTP